MIKRIKKTKHIKNMSKRELMKIKIARVERKKLMRKIRTKHKRLIIKVKKLKEHWKVKDYFPSVFTIRYT